MWTKANRLLLNPIKTLQMREEKKRSHTSRCLHCLIYLSSYFTEAYSIFSISEIIHFHSRIGLFCSEVMHLSLTLSSKADWFQAIIGSYWSHWSDAHLTYVVWPLKSFSLSFLSDSITAALQETLTAIYSHEQLQRLRLQQEPCEAHRTTMSALALYVSILFFTRKNTNEQGGKKGDTESRQLTTQETTKEDKTRQGNKRAEEKQREKDSLREQINSDFLFVSLKPAKFLQRSERGTSGRQTQWSAQPENDQQDRPDRTSGIK